MTVRTYRPELVGKALAGCVLGGVLAFIGSALVAWVTPGGPSAPNKFQFVMWITGPIWLAVASGVFFFRSAKAAWMGLGSVSCVGVMVYGAVRWLIGG